MKEQELPKSFKIDALEVRIYGRPEEMAAAAAAAAREHLALSVARQGEARVILATGSSQILFLDRLVELGGVNWSKVILFHMDEYLGITADHPGSFRRYMRERVENRLKPRKFHYIAGDALEPIKECERYSRLVRAIPADLSCLGIGENGHLAFNDPPVADFEDPLIVKLVQLDERCRQQQVGEGYFPSVVAVPQYAFTLTIPALCSAKKMICVVPEKRKAQAVKNALQGPISSACPASFLRRQGHCTLFLDADSGGLMSETAGIAGGLKS